jgi:ATP-dependent protease ClpP protease subunit
MGIVADMLRARPYGAMGVGQDANGNWCYLDANYMPMSGAAPRVPGTRRAMLPPTPLRGAARHRPQPNKHAARKTLNRMAEQINSGRVITPLVPLLRIEGDIDAALAGRVEAFCREHAGRDINLLIDSKGGYYKAGKRIYEALRKYGGQVCARVVGNCMSAATLALLAADFGEAVPDARFCLHNVEVAPEDNSNERWTASLHDATAKHLAGLDRELAWLMHKRTGVSNDKYLAVMREGRVLNADEALGLKLIASVIGGRRI